MFENYVYDVDVVNDVYVVNKYICYLERKGKQIMRKYYLTESEEVDDLPSKIRDLKKEGYLSSSQYFPEKFEGVLNINLKNAFKLFLLRNKVKLLFKIFVEVVNNDNIYLKTYINYINLDNGYEYLEDMGILGPYSKELVSKLEENDYKYVKSLNDSIVLNRKKGGA